MFQKLILRWFHSLTWILVGAACLLWSKVLALVALVTYVVFTTASMRDRKTM